MKVLAALLFCSFFASFIEEIASEPPCGYGPLGGPGKPEDALKCPANRPEDLYVFQHPKSAVHFLRFCCKLTPEVAEGQRAKFKGCQVMDCGASSDPCGSAQVKWVHGKKIELEEILKDKCTMKDGKQGYSAFCCPPNSEEGKLATLLGAELNEFPHQAKLKIQGNCGGTVYNKKYILTAAHCIVEGGKKRPIDNTWVAVIGTNNADTTDKQFIYPIKRMIVHEGYSQWDEATTYKKGKKEMFNDIALLELKDEIKFGDNVKSLEIATSGFQPEKYADHVAIIGWGITDLGAISPFLNKNNLPIRSDAKCYSKPTKVNKYSYWEYGELNLQDQLLCVGGIFDGTHAGIAGQGDSGGPAICRGEDGKAVLCGVTSFGANAKNCTKMQTDRYCAPTNYAEVGYFRDWIKKNAGEQDPSTFYKPYLYGAPVSKGKYDHQVHITSSSGKSCGGTLISPDVVVTAAQCVMKANKEQLPGLKVTQGMTDLKSGGGNSYNVVGTKGAPKFAQKKVEFDGKDDDRKKLLFGDNFYKDDLALVKLDKPVKISGKFPSLPDMGEDLETAKVTEIAFPKKTTISGELRSRDYRILSTKECQRRMDRLKDMAFKIDQSMLCGVEKYSGGSMCDRELGGGLICEKGGKKMLCGVQVFRMCEGSVPNGYVNMQMFGNWVEEAKNQL